MKNNFLTKITITFLLMLSILLISIKTSNNIKADSLPTPELNLSIDKTKLENGDDVIFTINMKYVTLVNLFDGCVIQIYQNGSKLTSVKMDSTGTVSVKYSIRSMFDTSFSTYAVFEGNESYSSCKSNTITYEFVEKIAPTIELTMINNQVNDNYNLIFTATISSPDSHSFEGEYFDLYDVNELNLVTNIKINNNNSSAYEYVVSGNQAVYHKFYVVYHGDDIYRTTMSNECEFGLVTIAVRTGVEEVCEDSELPISVTVMYGLSKLEGVSVEVYIDGKFERNLDIVNGIGTFNYQVPHGLRGSHTVQAKFKGSGAFIGATSDPYIFEVSTSKKPILVVTTARNAYTTIEKMKIVAVMVYEDKPIEGADIYFYFDDKAIGTAKTDKNGNASLEFPLVVDYIGTHKIKVEYLKNNDYAYAEDYTDEFEVFQKYYLVTFDLNGVEATSIDTKYVADGKKVEYPSIPKNKFYSFLGWYKDKECEIKFDFDTIITEDITLYAKWSMTSFLIEAIIIGVLVCTTILLTIIFIRKLVSKPTRYISNRKKYSRRRL